MQDNLTQDQNQTATPEPETPISDSQPEETQTPQETPMRPIVSQPPIATPMSWEHTGDPAQDILRNLAIGNDVKASAWDAYHKSKNEDELTQMIQGLNLPVSVKAQLWDAKHKNQRILSPDEQAQERHNKQALGWKAEHPNIVLPSNTPPTTMNKIMDTGQSVLEGVGKEGSKTIKGATNLVNQGLSGISNFVGDVAQGGQLLGGIASKASSPTAGLQVAQNLTQRTPAPQASPLQIPDPNKYMDLQTHGIAEGVGGLAEQTAEWLGPEEALKGAMQGFNLLAKAPPALLSLIQRYPRAAQLITSMAKGATIGGAQGAVKGAAEDQTGEGAVKGAEGGAIGTAIGENIVQPGIEAAGKGLVKIAPKSINSLLKANKVGDYLFGHNPGQSAIDEKIHVPLNSLTFHGQLENVAGQYQSAITSLSNQMQSILSDPAIAAKRLDIVPIVETAINDAKKSIVDQMGVDHPKYLKALDDLEDQMLMKYRPDGTPIGKMTRTFVSPAEVARMKTSIGKNTRWIDKSDPEFALKTYLNEVRKKVYGQFADEVEKAAPLAPVKEINRRLGNAIEAQGLLEKRIALEAGTGAWGAAARHSELLGALASILGGKEFGLPETGLATAGGFALDALRRTPAGRVATARGSAATGKALQGATQEVSPTLSPWLRMQLSNGQKVEVHPEDHDKLKERDPGAQIIHIDPEDLPETHP
jgi:hypothetical protein